jgi:hypothetical protein
MQVEMQMRIAIRDAVNRASRKPFYWGGLAGYQQLEAIVQALHQVPAEPADTAYLHQLAGQVDRALASNRALAQDLRAAYAQLQAIADCLRYPPSSQGAPTAPAGAVTGQQVQADMARLLREFQPDVKRQPAQTALYRAWHHVWDTVGPELLYCYDMPGLPPDNLQMETFFGQLRRNQRRISGRKSTAELRDFGQHQALFTAESADALLQQIRQVSWHDYQVQRQRLLEAEAPRKLLYRLHRDPLKTALALVDQHAARRAELATGATAMPP